MKKSHAAISLLAITVSATSSAAVFEGLSTQFNAMIFGNFYGMGGDTEGRHFTSGNVTVNDGSNLYTVADAVVAPDLPYSPGRHDLIIGGNFTGKAYVLTESAYVGGSLVNGVSTAEIQVYNGAPLSGSYYSSGTGTVTTNAGPFDIDLATGQAVASGSGASFDAILTGLRADSLAFSRLADTPGTVATNDGYGSVGITFTGDHDIYVYTVSEADWDGQKYRTITAPEDATVIINVEGSEIDLSGTMNVTGTELTNVIINYQEATSIAMTSMDHNGAMLAVNTTSYEQTAGGLNGAAFIAGEVEKNGGGEFHNHLFTGDLSAVPEPSSYALLVAMTAGAFVAARRRR
ncbi:choice-of-anchor A family protein [Coraliomargarita sp. SDUM461003]|uniref:Choice-of-anchor A family protein n=1 Tax=Thalassobacterium maritimum TaxID=3041265 RepID=A0ABU1ARK6_9BACT|nr:choice-of-anchor A family protein [Coraliomargarita sp. SDUM461003]MDQ8205884.1 choice-of-anchor A family protein [Coraliomargarita sp. SDUM461003]